MSRLEAVFCSPGLGFGVDLEGQGLDLYHGPVLIAVIKPLNSWRV